MSDLYPRCACVFRLKLSECQIARKPRCHTQRTVPTDQNVFYPLSVPTSVSSIGSNAMRPSTSINVGGGRAPKHKPEDQEHGKETEEGFGFPWQPFTKIHLWQSLLPTEPKKYDSVCAGRSFIVCGSGFHFGPWLASQSDQTSFADPVGG